MDIDKKIEALARKRLENASADIARTWDLFSKGDGLLAEHAQSRRRAANQRQSYSLRKAQTPPTQAGAEAKKGERDNFLPVSFLATGTSVSRAVARVTVGRRRRVASGFMCSPGLFITNKHVLATVRDVSDARVEFDFVEDDFIAPTVFSLSPSQCFVSDRIEGHDFSIVAIGDRISGDEDIGAFGWCPLSAADDKHALGEFANIIQHPDGRRKEVVLQDNLIMSRAEDIQDEDHILHYIADTEPGSSGSPVFNNEWQVIALHHWGESTSKYPARRAYDPKSVNQGIRTSRIVKTLRDRLPQLQGRERVLIEELIELGASVMPKDVMGRMERNRRTAPTNTSLPGPQSQAMTGASTWTVPLQITVSIPGLSPHGSHAITQPHQTEDRNDRDRDQDDPEMAEAREVREGEGYRADFLDHHIVPLPRPDADHEAMVLPLDEPERYPSAKPGEFQFTHFSTMMRRDRKLPFFGACNVDGKLLFGINDKGVDYDYTKDDISIFRASKAESGPGWKRDRRVSKNAQTVEDWYSGTNALVPRPGTDDAEKYIATADFDRGHIVRRTEPIWGPREMGHEANRHTFTHVNAAPQTPRFNRDQGRLPDEISEGEEERSWYAMEVAILRAATNDDKKMCVFTGPIYKETDPFFGGNKPSEDPRQVPLSFWKVAVWEDESELRALAMKYSQEWTLLRDDEEGGGAEGLEDESELFLLRDFLTTVADIESETGLIFDGQVQRADILQNANLDALDELKASEFAELLRTL